MKKLFFLAAVCLVGLSTAAQIKLPKLISNGMVLQRSAPLKLWGWAAPNESIELSFKDIIYHAKADLNGNWTLKLPAQKAGGPYRMILTASNKIILNDILFGDVWLCSGQSNMELPLARLIDRYPEEIAGANNNQIRQFLVPDEYDFQVARTDFSSGSWIGASPKNVLEFSGVAYFFALKINKTNHVPIGIINAALGGSPAQSWISEEAIKNFPAYAEEAQKFKDDKLIKSIEAADQFASSTWYNQLNLQDLGIKENWRGNLNDSNWAQMNLPGYWANTNLGPVNGVVWFRREFNISKEMLGQPAKLLLGRIVDADSVFVNGKFVGSTSYQYPPRRYLLSETILKEGINTIVVRVVNNSGNGGFVLDKPYQLMIGSQTVDLKGTWKYKLGAKTNPSPSQTFIRWKSTGLYNAMINPLTNYAIKGALWYQGEANTSKVQEYKKLMETLIVDWRKKWNQGDFPFLYVQLPNFMEAKAIPSESSWAALRQQQLELLTVPNTAMAVAIDLGEWNDIHPLNKKDVGERLALQAERLVYKMNMVASGPIVKGATMDKNKVIISFKNVVKGLIVRGKEPVALKYFAIAARDKKYVWAQAQIISNKVVVWSDAVRNPAWVRYAWADNPEGANLFSREGLPASPFEIGITQEHVYKKSGKL